MTTWLDDAPDIINLEQFCRQRRRVPAVTAELVEVPESLRRVDQCDALDRRLRRATASPRANAAGPAPETRSAAAATRPRRCRTARVEADLEHIVNQLQAEVDRLLSPWDDIGNSCGK